MDDDAYCPHCRGLLQEAAPHPFPVRPVRCGGCRLLVGPGRARDADGRPRRPAVRTAGPAASVDVVLGVLQDVREQTRDAGRSGAGEALRDG
ncbi:unannotated protein [freshwater metagenome]|uniref:Unannotated protein n=1 Tax=freshwater metagenome TaxID=449393 RepID=A0A6J7HBN6_9ZZZZ|nr:hypothetical protein [Actinomycetota bacterium]